MRQAIEITIERVQNGYLLSTIHSNQLIKRLYQGYPERIAVILFREYVRDLSEGFKTIDD